MSGDLQVLGYAEGREDLARPRHVADADAGAAVAGPLNSCLPAWRRVWPMMVASKVVWPTPFLPSTASEPRSASENATSSSTTVSPQPARTAHARRDQA